MLRYSLIERNFWVLGTLLLFNLMPCHNLTQPIIEKKLLCHLEGNQYTYLWITAGGDGRRNEDDRSFHHETSVYPLSHITTGYWVWQFCERSYRQCNDLHCWHRCRIPTYSNVFQPNSAFAFVTTVFLVHRMVEFSLSLSLSLSVSLPHTLHLEHLPPTHPVGINCSVRSLISVRCRAAMTAKAMHTTY